MDEIPTITPAVATDWYWLPAETGPAVPVAGTSVAACTAVAAADYQHHTLPVVVHTWITYHV